MPVWIASSAACWMVRSIVSRTSLPASGSTSDTTPVTSPFASTWTVLVPRTPCRTLSNWYSAPDLPTVSPWR